MFTQLYRLIRRWPIPFAGAGIILCAVAVLGLIFRLPPLAVILIIVAMLAVVALFVFLLVSQRPSGMKKEEQEKVLADRNEIRDQMTRGLAFLNSQRQRHLRSKAILREIPIYLMVGPAGAGKTTLIRQAEFRYPTQGPTDPYAKIAPTRSCELLVMDEAVFFDTAGRLSNHERPGPDRIIWLGLLELLREWRKGNPVNGVIVSVPLAGENGLVHLNELEGNKFARRMRQRVEEIFQEIRADVPVYLVFTKCDLLGGFSGFFSGMPDPIRSEAFGHSFAYFGSAPSPTAVDVERILRQICKNLQGHRLRILSQLKPGSWESTEAFLFPEQYQAAISPLMKFLREFLATMKWGNQPRLRGMYFTSSTQSTSEAVSHWIVRQDEPAFVLSPRVLPRKNSPAPFFVRDLFHQVLLRDKALSGSHRRRYSILRRGSLWGITAALFLVVLLWAVLWSGYENTRAPLAEFQRKLTFVRKDSTNIQSSYTLQLLGDMADRLRGLESTKDLVLGHGGLLFSSGDALAAVRDGYDDAVRRRVLEPGLHRMVDSLRRVHWPIPASQMRFFTAVEFLTAVDSARPETVYPQVLKVLALPGEVPDNLTRATMSSLSYYWRKPQKPLTGEVGQLIIDLVRFWRQYPAFDSIHTIWLCQGYPDDPDTKQLESRYQGIGKLTEDGAFPVARASMNSLTIDFNKGIDIFKNRWPWYETRLRGLLDSAKTCGPDARALAIDSLNVLESRFENVKNKQSFRHGCIWAAGVERQFKDLIGKDDDPDKRVSFTVSVRPPDVRAALYIDGEPKQLGEPEKIAKQPHMIKIIHPQFPIVEERLNVSQDNDKKTYDLEDLFANRQMIQLHIGVSITGPDGRSMRAESDTLAISFNRGECILVSNPPRIILRRRGKWDIAVSVRSMGGRQEQVDSCVTSPDEAGLVHASFPGGKFSIDFEEKRWQKATEKMPLVLVVFWKKH